MACVGVSLAIILLGGTSAGAQPSPPPGQPEPVTGQNVVPTPAVEPIEAPPRDLAHRPDLGLEARETSLKTRLDQAFSQGTLSRAAFDRGKARIAAVEADDVRLRQRHNGRLRRRETSRLGARLDEVSKSLR